MLHVLFSIFMSYIMCSRIEKHHCKNIYLAFIVLLTSRKTTWQKGTMSKSPWKRMFYANLF